jgi:hypothetical protein
MLVVVNFWQFLPLVLVLVFGACVAARVGVGELERSSQYRDEVGQTEKHQRNANEGVQHSDHLALWRLRGEVPVTYKNKREESYLRVSVSKQTTHGSKTVVMDVTGFLCVSLGISTVQRHDSLGSRRACACSETGFSSQNGDRA